MTIYGRHIHNGASCRVRVPSALPVEMRERIVELRGLTSRNPGQGEASALLGQVTTAADREGKHIILMVDGGDERLQRLYTRHGFAVIQDDPMMMLRKPHG